MDDYGSSRNPYASLRRHCFFISLQCYRNDENIEPIHAIAHMGFLWNKEIKIRIR